VLVATGCPLQPEVVRLGQMRVGVDDPHFIGQLCHGPFPLSPQSGKIASVYSSTVDGDVSSDEEMGMPVAQLNGMEIAYEVVGEGQPWVITPGGRFTKEVGGVPEMARALADEGNQVLTWDRPNCGASSVVFRGRSESEVQAEALGGLLRELDFGPTVIVGGSGGGRVSL